MSRKLTTPEKIQNIAREMMNPQTSGKFAGYIREIETKHMENKEAPVEEKARSQFYSSALRRWIWNNLDVRSAPYPLSDEELERLCILFDCGALVDDVGGMRGGIPQTARLLAKEKNFLNLPELYTEFFRQKAIIQEQQLQEQRVQSRAEPLSISARLCKAISDNKRDDIPRILSSLSTEEKVNGMLNLHNGVTPIYLAATIEGGEEVITLFRSSVSLYIWQENVLFGLQSGGSEEFLGKSVLFMLVKVASPRALMAAVGEYSFQDQQFLYYRVFPSTKSSAHGYSRSSEKSSSKLANAQYYFDKEQKQKAAQQPEAEVQFSPSFYMWQAALAWSNRYTKEVKENCSKAVKVWTEMKEGPQKRSQYFAYQCVLSLLSLLESIGGCIQVPESECPIVLLKRYLTTPTLQEEREQELEASFVLGRISFEPKFGSVGSFQLERVDEKQQIWRLVDKVDFFFYSGVPVLTRVSNFILYLHEYYANYLQRHIKKLIMPHYHDLRMYTEASKHHLSGLYGHWERTVAFCQRQYGITPMMCPETIEAGKEYAREVFEKEEESRRQADPQPVSLGEHAASGRGIWQSPGPHSDQEEYVVEQGQQCTIA